jgi:restriction system protein
MDPYAFEHLIKDLLEAMGYHDVEVTAPSNDKGVDVIGRIQLGITEVKEVIQVKRHRKTIQRKDLDALRGCLHRFQAVRATLITTSRFSSGTEKAAFEFGAAPITLIDGVKLVDLLAAHKIGVKKRNIEVWEVDLSAFSADEG